MKLWIAGAAVVVAGLILIAIQARPRSTPAQAGAAESSGDVGDDDSAESPSVPVPLRARADDPKAAERRYLEERRRAAEIEASKVIAEHEPSAYVDPEHDHTVIVPPLRKARDAFHAHRYEEAIAQLEAALAIDPDEKSARAMLVEAACTIGEEALAREHVAKLDPLRQKIAAKRCDARGVILPGIDWKTAKLP